MTEYLKLSAPPIDKREILRYAKSQREEDFSSILDDCVCKSGGVLNFNVCFCGLMNKNAGFPESFIVNRCKMEMF